MFSDGYTMNPIYEGAVMEVKATNVTVGGSYVPNLVAHHGLKEHTLDNAGFMAAIKAYLPRIVGHMKANGLEENVKPFRGGATEMVKFVVGKFGEFTFYTGENGDATGSLAFSYMNEEDSKDY